MLEPLSGGWNPSGTLLRRLPEKPEPFLFFKCYMAILLVCAFFYSIGLITLWHQVPWRALEGRDKGVFLENPVGNSLPAPLLLHFGLFLHTLKGPPWMPHNAVDRG